MTISGFSFVRNAVLFDYPFLESIQSVLSFCDEFVIAVGRSDDTTLAALRSLRSPKIRIIETEWDDSLRVGGAILAQQTNIALQQTTGDWAFYLQADEIIHENDLPTIRRAIEEFNDNSSVEGLLFNYKHFYGSYRYVANSRRWYRREIRIIRNGIGVSSWKDAQGFRIGTRKLAVKLIDASIYHYGWVKPPKIQQRKQLSFNRLWHSDEWVADNVAAREEYDYANGGALELYSGSHPATMKKRVESENWRFSYDPSKVRISTKEMLLNWIDRKTGRRFAEYRNYRIV